MKILVGTNNKNKLAEIKEIFGKELDYHIELITPNQLSPNQIEINETGVTFSENSKIKAVEFYNQFQIPTIADDSGLEVDQLGGEPGVNSARYSGDNATDLSNRKLLRLRLATAGLEHSSARFVCVMTYFDGIKTIQAEGVCEGIIIDNERGSNGFGYDSMFIPTGYNITFAELDSQTKNSISHRSKAIKNLFIKLKEEKVI